MDGEPAAGRAVVAAEEAFLFAGEAGKGPRGPAP
jgi:hypothetical protein